MSKTDFEKKRCFICGEFGANSKDHIPPKVIFLQKTKIYKSLSRPEAKWFRKEIVESMQPVELTTPSGIFLQKTMQLPLDRKRIDGMIKKIIRGLYYYETKHILPLQNKINVLLIQKLDKHIISIAKLMTIEKVFGDETFKYRWLQFTDEQNSTMFLMSFYKSVIFLGVTYDRNSKLNNVTSLAMDAISK